jgi:hypothetical protein
MTGIYTLTSHADAISGKDDTRYFDIEIFETERL